MYFQLLEKKFPCCQKEHSLLLDLNKEAILPYNKGNEHQNEMNTTRSRMKRQRQWSISWLLDQASPETALNFCIMGATNSLSGLDQWTNSSKVRSTKTKTVLRVKILILA